MFGKSPRSVFIFFLSLMVTFARMSTNATAQSPFHENPNKLVVTRGDKVIRTLPCQRIALDGKGQWKGGTISASLCRTKDGTFYAIVGYKMFASNDQGQTWQSSNIPLQPERVSVFTVLSDDTFMFVAESAGSKKVSFFTSTGGAPQKVSQITRGVFDLVMPDGILLQLRDGTILLPMRFDIRPPGKSIRSATLVQCMMRSKDGGLTWHNGPDMDFWNDVKQGNRTVTYDTKEYQYPGPGATFPGCFETDIEELADGTVLAAFRYSGWPLPWHKDVAKAWNAAGSPDVHGRIFRHVMLGSSSDGGSTWRNLRPVADGKGKTLLVYGECNGELLPMSDGSVVLIHQRRYPRDKAQIIARVSKDGGRSWLRDEYRLSFGFGHSDSLALEDGTIITVTGKALLNASGKRISAPGAQVIRWRLPGDLQ